MRDDSVQSTYYLWRGHSGKASRWPSALLLVARESWVIFGIFLVRAPCLSRSHPDNPFLNVSSPHAHTDTDTCQIMHSFKWMHTHMHALPSSLVAWSYCKVPKSAAYMLGRWERTSWKQWNGLICRFASGFDKSPCSKPMFLWPLVKNFSSLPVYPFRPCSLCE